MTEPVPLYPVWVHRLVFPFRYGKLAAGLLIFVVMWVLVSEGSGSGELGFYIKLFFCRYVRLHCAGIQPYCRSLRRRL